MKQLKRTIGAVGASLAIALSAAGVAAADSSATNNCQSGFELVGGSCVAISVDKSHTTTYSVNGNCSGIIQTTIEQSNNNSTSQNQDTDNTNVNGLSLGNDQNINSDPSQSNTTTQSNNGSVTFAPDCSTTTQVTQQVTTAAAKTAPAAPAQVQAPKGGVGAGAGGATGSAIAPLAALGGSLASIGVGVARLRKTAFGINA